MNITIETNIGTVGKDNALWLRMRGRTLLRQYAQDELRTQLQLRGKGATYLTTVDNSRSKPIARAERLVIIDFTEARELNVSGIIARIADLIYRVTTPPLKTRPNIPGVLGQGWRADLLKAGTTLARSTSGRVMLEQGDNVRLHPAADYAAPLTATVAKGRLKQFIARKAKRGRIAGDVVVVKPRAVSSRGFMSLLARALQRDTLLDGFRVTGRYLKKPSSSRIRTSVAIDIKMAIGKLIGRRR